MGTFGRSSSRGEGTAAARAGFRRGANSRRCHRIDLGDVRERASRIRGRNAPQEPAQEVESPRAEAPPEQVAGAGLSLEGLLGSGLGAGLVEEFARLIRAQGRPSRVEVTGPITIEAPVNFRAPVNTGGAGGAELLAALLGVDLGGAAAPAADSQEGGAEVRTELDGEVLEQLERDAAERETAARAAIERQLRGALGELDFGAAGEPVEARLERALAGLEPHVDGVEGLREGIQQVLLEEVAASRRAAERARDDAVPEDARTYERRIAKLTQALEDSRDELRKVLEAEFLTEQGIASIYRNVQGLDDRDMYFETKRELMVDIFQANKKLHEELKTSA
jgi:hypothetical protein